MVTRQGAYQGRTQCAARCRTVRGRAHLHRQVRARRARLRRSRQCHAKGQSGHDNRYVFNAAPHIPDSMHTIPSPIAERPTFRSYGQQYNRNRPSRTAMMLLDNAIA